MRKKKQGQRKVCPAHGTELLPAETRYGTRYGCTAPGCTVACWGGKTSTPADAETRELRRRCHELFDPLWKTGSRFKSRSAAYRWLARLTGTKEPHIGHFDRSRCEQLLAALTPSA